MKRIRVPEFGDASVLEMEEAAAPEPGAGEVLIDVESIGVNYADIDQREGRYKGGPEPPFTPGLEGAGIVRGGDTETAAFGVGDEVVFWGPHSSYAETITANVDWTAPVPETVDLQTAGGLPIQGVTAHNCLVEWGGMEAGETVLINAAAGGIGTMAVQTASANGATVVGTASTDRKLELASDLGAEYLVQYTEEDVVEAVRDRVPGGAVDLVLDGVGGKAFKRSMEVLAPGGTMVSYGVASGRPPTVTTPRLYYRNYTVKGYHMLRAMSTMREQVMDGVTNFYSLVENGDVRPITGNSYPLADASQAHRDMENRETTGRPLLVPE